ncbi:brachyurin [Cryptotermes secundus]|uniref:brachyurin n=1 Tax=Cryptotermes secundus TaxID=105785 RepID=UPI001454CD64|nr:brachyurin [Cryptotermes secundus]
MSQSGISQPRSSSGIAADSKQNHALRFNSGAIAYRGQFPWQAAIVIDDSSFCGGALISNYWVLTAAHCRGNTYYVRLGANRLDIQEYGSLDVTGRYMETYPGYNPTLLLNDIAVIRLSQCVQFTSYIAPARLPNRLQQSETFAGETLRVSGWGIISDSGSGVSPDLAYSDIIGITNYDCTRFYGKAITPSKLCATAFNDDTTCHGDAGGPLVFFDRGGYYILVGIVSFGSKSGCQFGNPVAFSRVTSFLTWIKPYAI